MKTRVTYQIESKAISHPTRAEKLCFRAPYSKEQTHEGFSLIELLVVLTILPMIVGALTLGLVSVFSLQSSVTNRLSDTGDAQVISANYQKDIQGAAYVTVASSVDPQTQCGAGIGTQLLGLESDLDQTTGAFRTVISYVSVPSNSGSTTAYSLIRLYCTGGYPGGGYWPPSKETTLAFDLPKSQLPPAVSCVASASASACTASAQQWVSAQIVSTITFTIVEPKSAYTFTLNASPIASTSSNETGSPLTAATTTSCNFPSAGSGTYASTLCFVDFSVLSGAALTAAETGCLEISVRLPGDNTMYFCISLSGGPVAAYSLPTYPEAFLGNTIGGAPFYTNIQGKPALYQSQQGTTSTVAIKNITIVSPSGALATGWEAVSADAESTDSGESITWTTGTTNANLTVIANGESGQTQPVGNACQNGSSAGLTGSGSETVVCSGGTSETSGQKTGTAMVEATSPSNLTATMVGNGLQAITFGLLLS